MQYKPAVKPTLYFIGVTTSKSSIMRVFPEWAKHLELGDVAIQGIDFELHAEPELYRQAVNFIKHDPLSVGALVTTHKLDLFAACRDLFDVIDPHAQLMSETSCLSKQGGQLVCHAKDPISSGLAIEAFLPAQHFAQSNGDLFSMGAGGSTIAITWYLLQKQRNDNRPARIIVSNRSKARLHHLKKIHQQINAGIPIEYVLAMQAQDNDAILHTLSENSLVINATGLGKDAPGSPLTDLARFPKSAIVWDLNYRGDLHFLQQAKAQSSAQSLQIEDGWIYFLHGWTQVLAEVFNINIPTYGPQFERLGEIASDVGSPT